MDTATEMRWSFIPSMTTNHSVCAAIVVDGKLCFVEEKDGKKCLSSCETHPSEKPVSPFYTKLIESDDRNIHFKINELIPMVEDVHQLKYLYTFIRCSQRLGYLDIDECCQYIKSALEQVTTSTTTTDAVAVFKLVLDKAIEDSFICRYTKYILEIESEDTHTSHAPFVKDLWKHINANTARIEGIETRIEGLETRVERLEARTERLEACCEDYHQSLVQLQEGTTHIHKAESVTGMMGALINAISFGAMGSATSHAMKSTISSIVDFGDLSHIKDVVNDIRDDFVSYAFDYAVAMVKKLNIEKLFQGGNDINTISKENLHARLVAAANDGNPLMAVVVTAYVMNIPYKSPVAAHGNDTNCPPQKPPTLGDRVWFLEQKLCLESVPSTILKRLENLELRVFDEIHGGVFACRVAALEEKLGLN